MARRPRASRLENRTSRLKLPVRWKPYDFTPISPGIALGYRRNKAAGVWVVRVADGRGGSWTRRVGIADDYEDADGEHVLTWWEAIEKARKLARGTADDGRPQTVREAVDAYERDLIARGGSVANAGRIRKHLTPALSSKPVAILTARQLSAWRDALLAGGMRSVTTVRLIKAFKAALNLAAKRDHRITNTAAWRDGLGGLAEDLSSRNVQRLADERILALIAAAYAIDSAFGLYVEVHAATGSRTSQISGLQIVDLQADNGTPRLLMPASRKGKNRKPAKRPVPITPALAEHLQAAAGKRPGDAPLLLRSDGKAWQSSQDGDHERLYRQAAQRAGVEGTIYALRHSSIIRSLLANVPIRVVAAMHDTSVGQIEKVYSSHITDFADAVARPALLDTALPAKAAKVVKLPRR
jgi:integrase